MAGSLGKGEGAVTPTKHSQLRFLITVVLLVSAAAFLRAHSRPEILPPRRDLAAFPRRLGDWSGPDSLLPAGVVDVLGPGEFLTRLYQRKFDSAYIDLFVGYFPSQRTGNTIHSPQNCLPGAGWTPIEAGRFQLTLTDGKLATLNRYVLAKGPDRLLVLYWYQAHGRIVASEYWAKFYLVADAIRLNRTDGALVRVVTRVASDESPASAQHRAAEFARTLLPKLDSYIPR
jgi:EpsI family protein